MRNVYTTLAIGAEHSGYAKFLAADFQVYKMPLVVLTDHPEYFKEFRYVEVVEYRPPKWNFHDKRLALKEALKRGDTAIFVDADTAVWFGADRRDVRIAMDYEFPPGLHATRLLPAGTYDYPHHEAQAKEWGLEFDRNVITYWEALFALTKDPKVDKFFEIWDRFAADSLIKKDNGVGEGTCFGIACEASGLTKHYTTYMVKSSLPFLFWHSRLAYQKRKLYHLKYALKEMARGSININSHCWA